MLVPPDSAGWRGWSSARTDAGPTVTSDRLDDSAVASRFLPKIRSWFALGAPVELLSPLSVLRVVAVVALINGIVATTVGAIGTVGAIAWVAVTVVLLVGLAGQRHVAPRPCVIVAFLLAALTAAAIGTGRPDGPVLVLTPLLGCLAAFVGLFFSFRLLVAHQALTTAMLSVALIATRGRDEAIESLAIGLACAIAAATVAVVTRSARRSAAVDADTGLPNAYGMADRLAALGHSTTTTIVVTVHLQGVAEARDALGHQVGSELVRRAVEDLGQVLPAVCSIGRGSEHDVVILVPSSARDAQCDIGRTLSSIEAAIGSGRYLVDAVEVSLLAHVGTVVSDPDDDSSRPTELLRRSALAAQAARRAGVAHAVWDGRSSAMTAEDLALLAALRTAGERGELWLAYQPQVRACDRVPHSVEALLRWQSPIYGSVPPDRFIPLAERTGLIDRLTDLVLAQALDAQVRWRLADVHVRVSVNVSPLSLRSIDFADRVGAALAERSLPAQVLLLEVTESSAFDVPQAVERLAPLRDRGVAISIDDFGTGYTSLSILPHLPLDELKVDQKFITDLVSSPASEAIARSVCELAHRLGLTAVAEGVEDEQVAALVTSFGFDLLQGYHFARPMAEHDLIDYLRTHRCPNSEHAALSSGRIFG